MHFTLAVYQNPHLRQLRVSECLAQANMQAQSVVLLRQDKASLHAITTTTAALNSTKLISSRTLAASV